MNISHAGTSALTHPQVAYTSEVGIELSMLSSSAAILHKALDNGAFLFEKSLEALYYKLDHRPTT
jgi:hypothetical protein